MNGTFERRLGAIEGHLGVGRGPLATMRRTS
jgi:hypothetical protein